jgi:hypothetical protein
MGYSTTSSLASNPDTAQHCSRAIGLEKSTQTDKNRLTGAVIVDVAKAFDTVWAKNLLYNPAPTPPPPVNLQIYLVRAIKYSLH